MVLSAHEMAQGRREADAYRKQPAAVDGVNTGPGCGKEGDMVSWQDMASLSWTLVDLYTDGAAERCHGRPATAPVKTCVLPGQTAAASSSSHLTQVVSLFSHSDDLRSDRVSHIKSD